jgi:hypothetical protein
MDLEFICSLVNSQQNTRVNFLVVPNHADSLNVVQLLAQKLSREESVQKEMVILEPVDLLEKGLLAFLILDDCQTVLFSLHGP